MFKRIFWLEDQSSDLAAISAPLIAAFYDIEVAEDITQSLRLLSENKGFHAYIFDLIVPPGTSTQWRQLHAMLREEQPHTEPRLGLEFLRAILHPTKGRVPLDKPIRIEPSRIIVLSVVREDELYDLLTRPIETGGFGIPKNQVIAKSAKDKTILKRLVESMP